MCNAAFLALCDAGRFKNDDCESVLVLSPMFRNDETANEVREATERGMLMVDAMHMGGLDWAADNLLHISRVGRKHAVFVELFAIRNAQKELLEYIAIETLMDPAIYQPGEHSSAELLVSDSTPMPAPGKVCAAPYTFVFRAGVRKELQWRDARIKTTQSRSVAPPPAQFVCDFCSSRNTTRPRYTSAVLLR